ncbi:hypothetical protein SNEBB_011327 [Seison nebaliae]|nr:hypothetical protein SNEBB_011327 [Seison nebaliae]
MALSHEELIREMENIERLSAGERLLQAKKRRELQLEKYHVYESSLNDVPNEVMLDHESDVHFTETVTLLDATFRNDIEEVKRLLDEGVDPNVSNEDGLTALHQTCIDNNVELLKCLLEKNADVNIRDHDGWTPLHAAATCGHKDVSLILIENNADVLAVNTDGNMPYDICEDNDTLIQIEMKMADQGITQKVIDETRSQPERDLLRRLRELKEVVENSVKNSLLTAPKSSGQLVSMQFSLPISQIHQNTYKSQQETLGKDFDSKDNATYLHVAAAYSYFDVIKFLIDECNVEINPTDSDGWTPLHAATWWTNPQIIQYLIEHSADLYKKNDSGNTPLDICPDQNLVDWMLEKRQQQQQQQQKEINNCEFRSNKEFKRTGSTVNRTSSIRRASMREKARKYDTNFAEVVTGTTATPPPPSRPSGKANGEESSSTVTKFYDCDESGDGEQKNSLYSSNSNNYPSVATTSAITIPPPSSATTVSNATASSNNLKTSDKTKSEDNTNNVESLEKKKITLEQEKELFNHLTIKQQQQKNNGKEGGKRNYTSSDRNKTKTSKFNSYSKDNMSEHDEMLYEYPHSDQVHNSPGKAKLLSCCHIS